MRARELISSFGALHAANTVFSFFYTFFQFFVLARVLSTDRYPEIVFISALGLYLIPLNQAMGRATFIAIRHGQGADRRERGFPEVIVFLLGEFVLLTTLALASPLVLPGKATEQIENVLFLQFCFMNNFWFAQVQSIAWAFDLGRLFERFSAIRVVLNVCALIILWYDGSFLTFTVLTSSVSAGMFWSVAREAARRPETQGLKVSPFSLGWRAFFGQIPLIGHALTASLIDLIVLNSPYALLSAKFGVGPALVAFDTMMKLARAALTFDRSATEIALPRLSRRLAANDRSAVARLFWLVILLCLAAALGGAAIILALGLNLFAFLLGPNALVPAEIVPLTAFVVVMAAIYQPAALLLGYNNAQAAVRTITVISIAGLAAYVLAVWFWDLSLLACLYGYAAFFAYVALSTLVLGARAFSAANRTRPNPDRVATPEARSHEVA